MTASDFILQDLRARMASGEPLPAKLSLSDLANYYSVSYTPVRVALRTLLAEKYIEKQSNGRFAVLDRRVPKDRLPTAPLPIPPPGEDTLAGDVIQRSLAGHDDFLREEATAEKYGVGRTVLRQMLHRLAGRGLVEHVRHRGWRIHPFREEDMLAFLEIREMLELRALDLAHDRLDRAVLEHFLIANTPDERGQPRLDDKLHDHWIERSANRYIIDFFARHGPYFRALFNHAAMASLAIEAETSAEHRTILRALLRSDFDRAKLALSDHIRGQQPKVAQMFELLKGKGP
jgi:DNA-binding GntR family transcriptional regulator